MIGLAQFLQHESLGRRTQQEQPSPRHCRAPHVPKGAHLGCRLGSRGPPLSPATNIAMEVAIRRMSPSSSAPDGCRGSDGASALSCGCRTVYPDPSGSPWPRHRRGPRRFVLQAHHDAHPVRSSHSDRSPIVEPSHSESSARRRGGPGWSLGRILPLARTISSPLLSPAVAYRPSAQDAVLLNPPFGCQASRCCSRGHPMSCSIPRSRSGQAACPTSRRGKTLCRYNRRFSTIVSAVSLFQITQWRT